MKELLEKFNGLKTLVVGDVMIDVYSKGVVERMSPEAPVPIVNLRERFQRLGGAANVALNLKALGAEPLVCSIIGDDESGKALLQLMQEQGLEVGGLVSSNRRKTTVKHRILDGLRQLLRIDEEDTHDLTEVEHSILIHVIRQTIGQKPVDVVVLQDYNKGVLTEKMIQEIIALCQEKSIPIVVDPKKKNFFAYQGATLFKPNAKELREGLGVPAGTLEELQQAMLQLQERIACQYLMVTLSDKGVMISHDGAFHHLSAHPREIADVSGAGDTVLSVAALCTALQVESETIASLSNIAGGMVCEEVGVVPIDKKKFAEEVKRIYHE
jgi:rfaE bifunctional protein kinase chain/domain